MFNALPGFLQSGLAFLVVLGILVFVHEFGHYVAARWCGVHVDVFSIGFGRAIASWQDKVGTTWKLAWLPLGGYVKLHGLERPETASPTKPARGGSPGGPSTTKAVLSRAIVVAAGPIANFVLAAVLFAALFATAGKPVIAAGGGRGGRRLAGRRGRAADRRPDRGDRRRARPRHSRTSSGSSAGEPGAKIVPDGAARRGGADADRHGRRARGRRQAARPAWHPGRRGRLSAARPAERDRSGRGGDLDHRRRRPWSAWRR